MNEVVRAAFHTLGCKVNQQETAAVAATFVRAGFSIVPFQADADAYVINSCVVTAQAERRSRNAVRRLRSRAPHALIVLAGCFPQVAGEEALDTGADLLVGSSDKARIVELVSDKLAGRTTSAVSISRLGSETEFERIAEGAEPGRTRAFLKVQDGCEQFCRYCIVPYARGPERSLPAEDVVKEARGLVERGYREIVLTGIRLGAYGRDLHCGSDIALLAQEVLKQASVERLRFGSLEPNDINDNLINLVRESGRICRHLHIPLQSGCDSTLERMGRPYRAQDFAALLGKLRREVPSIGITTDIIAGFPGESETDYLVSERFLREIAPSRTHVFRYSRRIGTPAADMKHQVPESVKAARASRLTQAALECTLMYHRSCAGKQLRVLVETAEGGLLEGHSSEYVHVSAEGPAHLLRSVVTVLVEGTGEMGVHGRIVQEKCSAC